MQRNILFNILICLFLIHCFANVKPNPIKGCLKIDGMPGPEDFALDREKGILYVSSHERRIEGKNGSIFAINLNEPANLQKKVAIQSNYPDKFKPHGISIANTKEGKRLYVISHPDFPNHTTNQRIEIFSIGDDGFSLTYITTLKDELLTSPNDLFALEDGRILVSNDHGTGSKARFYFDDAFKIKRSPIVLFDGTTWKKLPETESSFGNGILVLKKNDKNYLYRSATLEEKIYSYEISDWKNFTLKAINPIELGTSPDNLESDEDGNIWTAGHISMFRFLGHAGSKEKHSPSQIIKIFPDGKFKEVYANEGEEISAASGGIVFNKRLYISQVFEDYLLSCALE